MANDGKYLTLENGRTKQESAIGASAGGTDASKLVKTDGSGKLDPTLMPAGFGSDSVAIATSENLAAG